MLSVSFQYFLRLFSAQPNIIDIPSVEIIKLTRLSGKNRSKSKLDYRDSNQNMIYTDWITLIKKVLFIKRHGTLENAYTVPLKEFE